MIERLVPIGGIVAFAAAIFVAGLRPAEGTYENARAVGKRCATCHTSVRPNAGTLNETGRFYQTHRTLQGAPGVEPAGATARPGGGRPSAAPKAGTARAGAGARTAAGPAATATVAPAAAAETFKQMCAPCHGVRGEGTPTGKAFAGGTIAAKSPEAVAQTIRGGVPGTAMAAFGGVLSQAHIEALARHVIALGKAR